MKQQFKYLIIHCTATRKGQMITPETVRRWHIAPPPAGRGWSVVGYSDLILLDGSRHQYVRHNGDIWIDPGEITNGVKGMNSVSRHVCYVGGLSTDGKKSENTMTPEQSNSLQKIIREVLQYAPAIEIAGHNQFSNKGCPSFWVPTYLREIGIQEKNIYKNNPYNYGK